MIASLGMYDTPATAPALDRLWDAVRQGLSEHGIAAPKTLTRGEAAYWPTWQSADLILSQTCGYPYRARLYRDVTLIGAADHRLPDTAPGHYHSVLVARADDPRADLAAYDGAGLVWNEDLSQSGWAAPMNHAANLGLRLRPAHRSGGHRASARALRAGFGDLAALDAVTFAIMTEDGSGDADGLRVIARTPATPALPFITGPGQDGALLYAVLAAAIAAQSQSDRDLLHLHGLVPMQPAAYLAIPNPPPPAQFQGTN